MKFYNIKFVFFLITLLFSYSSAISSGANEPIADNELGLTAKDCAKQYCDSKDGLGLWLTLVGECVDSPNPYLVNTKDIYQNDKTIFNYKFSPIVTGSLCAMAAVVGMLFGYVFKENVYNDNYQRYEHYEPCERTEPYKSYEEKLDENDNENELSQINEYHST